MNRLNYMQMMSHLKPILIVLLALIVCSASSRAAVCELSCGLDAPGMACHMTAPSQEMAMQGMAHGHCASEPGMQMTGDAGSGAKVDSLHNAACGHTFTPAVENKSAAKIDIGLSATLSTVDRASGDALPRVTTFSERRPPPLINPARSLLIALRV